jgi:hypothetical protein
VAEKTGELQPPGARRKCHAKAVNAPGWLEVTTFATCAGGRCVINGAGEEHKVIIRSDSPLPYYITVRGTCTTDGVAYLDGDNHAKDWTPNDVFLAGWRRGRAAQRELAKNLSVVEASDDETLQVGVSWKCTTFAGDGLLAEPLVIQVDTRATNGS